jgi:exosome complex component MTR3
VERVRAPSVSFGVITQATGSALVELGDTKVLCGVCAPLACLASRPSLIRPGSSYGPREASGGYSDAGVMRVDVKFAAFARRAQHAPLGRGAEERKLAAAVSTALTASVLLERFPKSQVDVFLLVLDACGAEPQAAICAASCALAHAGVEMRDLVSAAAVALLPPPPGGPPSLLLDPLPSELPHAEATALVAALAGSEQLALLSLAGEWGGECEEALAEALEAGLEAARGIDTGLRAALREAVQKETRPG